MARKRGKILIVEDQELQRLVLQCQLEKKLGYRVDAAASGSEALDLLDRHRYAAVLMDCQMPGMDGYETTRRLRAGEGDGARTVVIAVTAHQGGEELARCCRAGMDDVVSKPIGIHQIEAVLASWTSVETAGRAARVPVDFEALAPLGATCVFPHLVRVYLEDGPRKLREMRRALASSDSYTFQTMAHALGGNSSALRALPLSERCRQLEELARCHDLEGCKTGLRRVEAAFEQVASTLANYLPESSTTIAAPVL